jgi:hypothetical protein
MTYRTSGDNGMEYKESLWEKCIKVNRALGSLVATVVKIAIPISVAFLSLGFLVAKIDSCSAESTKESRELIQDVQTGARRWAQENPQLHIPASTIICLDPIYASDNNNCHLGQMACHAVKTNGTSINLTCTRNGCFIPQ